MTRHDHGAATQFELTIAGRLGPVLRWALRPSTVVDSHTCTTICTETESDLAELVALLDSHGLQIEGIWVADRSRDSAETSIGSRR
ncbi:hypothetical protein [Nocardioides sp.]|uniref:hypothetical protein n=1 Tax=Nocardioides sp. TaxID=35761 RepID=UPI002ED0D6B4